MFKKITDKLKDDWLNKHEEALSREFESDLQELKDSFSKTISEWHEKRNEIEKQIKSEEHALSLQQNEYSIILKKLESSKKSVEDQIRILELKSTPSNVWSEAFACGFSKAWDMMLPLMTDGVNRLRKSIEDKAIQDTLERMNGNYKAHN